MTLSFDPLSVAFTADPHPDLKMLRETDPVHFFEPLGCWMLTRYDDVRMFFSDRRVKWIFNSDLFDETPVLADTSAHRGERGHQRNAIYAACSPKTTATGMALIDRVVADCLAPFREREGIVDVAPILGAIPNLVVARYFGVAPEEEDKPEFLRVTRAAFRHFNIYLTDEERKLSGEALTRFREMLAELVHERREHPASDKAIDLFVASREGGGLSDEVIMSWLSGLIMAGSEATAQSGLAMLRLLLTYPDQADRLRRDPSLIPNAVLEMLRFDLMGKFIARIATEDFTLRGHQIREGESVWISPTAAHRDPAAFPDPDRFDVGRDTTNEMVFGRGPYSCIGAQLAFAQLVSLLRQLLDLFPRGSYVLEDQLEWNATRLNIRLLDVLPICRVATASDAPARDALAAAQN